jgi:hypothetical protein
MPYAVKQAPCDSYREHAADGACGAAVAVCLCSEMDQAANITETLLTDT